MVGVRLVWVLLVLRLLFFYVVEFLFYCGLCECLWFGYCLVVIAY